MSDLQQSLEVLLGQKIRDEVTGLWHVYDANGVEISDPGGILLRANPGALLAWPNPVVDEIVQQDGGGPDSAVRAYQRLERKLRGRYDEPEEEFARYAVPPADWKPGWFTPPAPIPATFPATFPANPPATFPANPPANTLVTAARRAVPDQAEDSFARQRKEAAILAAVLVLMDEED